jgi:hypothetical protein
LLCPSCFSEEIASRATGSESARRNGSQPETSEEDSEHIFLLLINSVEYGRHVPWPEIQKECGGNGMKLVT